MHFRRDLPVKAAALRLSSRSVTMWPWDLPRLPRIGSIVWYAIKTWAFLAKRFIFIILIGIIATFNFWTKWYRYIDTVSVGFGKAPVRCSSLLPAGAVGIHHSPGMHALGLLTVLVISQPPGTSMFLTKPVWVCLLRLPMPGSPTLLHRAECWGKAGLHRLV